MKEPKEANAVLCRADGSWICVIKRVLSVSMAMCSTLLCRECDLQTIPHLQMPTSQIAQSRPCSSKCFLPEADHAGRWLSILFEDTKGTSSCLYLRTNQQMSLRWVESCWRNRAKMGERQWRNWGSLDTQNPQGLILTPGLVRSCSFVPDNG